jgi:hypothetical protein
VIEKILPPCFQPCIGCAKREDCGIHPNHAPYYLAADERGKWHCEKRIPDRQPDRQPDPNQLDMFGEEVDQ